MTEDNSTTALAPGSASVYTIFVDTLLLYYCTVVVVNVQFDLHTIK